MVAMAKFTKLPYPLSHSHSTCAFELIHKDNWGPYRVATRDGTHGYPSSVLKFKTPYEMLLNEVPSYDHLRLFRCLAMANNPSRTTNKFAERGVPYLFIGYPLHQKGYKLYNLQTHFVFVSRDVVFYEHMFPFSASTMLPLMHPLPFSNTGHNTKWFDDFVSPTSTSDLLPSHNIEPDNS
ncbi:cysteine-rich receptor-like protein kinase 8 [Tanacetum coccineum]